MDPTNNTLETTAHPESIPEKAGNALRKLGAGVLIVTMLATAGCSSQEKNNSENSDPDKKIEAAYEHFSLNKNITKVSIEEGARARATYNVTNGTDSDPTTNIIAILNEGIVETPHGAEYIDKTNNGVWLGVLVEDIRSNYPDIKIPKGCKIVYINTQKCDPICDKPTPQASNNIK